MIIDSRKIFSTWEYGQIQKEAKQENPLWKLTRFGNGELTTKMGYAGQEIKAYGYYYSIVNSCMKLGVCTDFNNKDDLEFDSREVHFTMDTESGILELVEKLPIQIAPEDRTSFVQIKKPVPVEDDLESMTLEELKAKIRGGL